MEVCVKVRYCGGILLAAAVGLVSIPAIAPACIVGLGTSSSCTETALDLCLPTAVHFDGTVTFSCGGAKTFVLSGSKTISANTTIDGGGIITLQNTGSAPALIVDVGETLTAKGLIFTGSSDGIQTAGAVTVENCTFDGNSEGIFCNSIVGSVIATQSTFANASAIAVDCGGGVTVADCTFFKNAIGGIDVEDASVENCTFADNGQAIGHGGTVTVSNTILTGSTSGNCDSPVTDGGHNIDSGSTCGFTGSGCSNTSGTSFCNTGAGLDPAGLKNNGGPTETIALLRSSPAVNAGFNAVCQSAAVDNVDQRGVQRVTPSDPICDIGAFEFQPFVGPAPVASPFGLLALSLLLAAVAWRYLGARQRGCD